MVLVAATCGEVGDESDVIGHRCLGVSPRGKKLGGVTRRNRAGEGHDVDDVLAAVECRSGLRGIKSVGCWTKLALRLVSDHSASDVKNNCVAACQREGSTRWVVALSEYTYAGVTVGLRQQGR